jgi:hypothetical protein
MEVESEQSENNDLSKNEASSPLAGIDSLGTLSAIFLGTIYLCGFLTLNSHLYKYGVVELGIASTEYLVAGTIFVLYLVVYGLFAGRGIVMSQRWLGQQIDHLRESGAPAISPLVAFIHLFIEMAFLHCLSAALFSVFAFGQVESAGFYAVLSIVFIISYAMDTSNWDIRYPFAHLIIDAVLKLIAVFSFFYLSSGTNIYIVFAAFFGYSFYINMVLDSFQRYRLTRERIGFNLVYTAVFFLLAAISFGSGVYGNISNKLGGGKPLEMTIGLQPNSIGGFPEELKLPIVGNVVYSSADNMYIKIEKTTLVIPRSSVQWMRFQEADDSGFLNLINGFKKGNSDVDVKEEPNKSSNADGASAAGS